MRLQPLKKLFTPRKWMTPFYYFLFFIIIIFFLNRENSLNRSPGNDVMLKKGSFSTFVVL